MKAMKMQTSLLCWLVLSAPGVLAQGLELYREGRYQESARAFRKALEAEPLDARLNYNLALTLWRLGEGDDAETKAEIAATLGLDTLRDGILGNLRFQAALAKAEAGDLGTAVDLMAKARAHYQRGALRRGAGPALARNLERAIRKQEELRKKLEEQKKKEEEQKKKEDKDKNKDNEQDTKDQDDKDQDKKEKKSKK